MGLMVPQCSHITRKRGIYTYRRRLPRPLQGEVALSLGTDKFRVAEAFDESRRGLPDLLRDPWHE